MSANAHSTRSFTLYSPNTPLFIGTVTYKLLQQHRPLSNITNVGLQKHANNLNEAYLPTRLPLSDAKLLFPHYGNHTQC